MARYGKESSVFMVFSRSRNSGLSLAEAVKVVDLLDLALQAPEETKQRRIAARSVLTRCCLPFLCLTELFVCGLLIYTLESSTGGWNIGKCSLVTFTNITCTEQTTRCAVDVEVRATQGDLRRAEPSCFEFLAVLAGFIRSRVGTCRCPTRRRWVAAPSWLGVIGIRRLFSKVFTPFG